MEKQSNKRNNSKKYKGLEMINKDWHSINYFSVILVTVLSFIGAGFNTKRYCVINKDKCGKHSKKKLFFVIVSHIVFDAISVGSISLIVYIGLVGYGLNELLSVAIAGFLAKEGNVALYQFKIFVADKFGSDELLNELKKEKEAK